MNSISQTANLLRLATLLLAAFAWVASLTGAPQRPSAPTASLAAAGAPPARTVVSWGPAAFTPHDLTNIVAVAPGAQHTTTLRVDGTVGCWGGCWIFDAKSPGLTDAIAVSAAATHVLALRSDGTVVAWGDDYFGDTIVPADLTDVIDVKCGDFQSFALKASGTVVTWGREGSSLPPGFSNVTAISVGRASDTDYFHALALRGDGTVVAWGPNTYGEGTIPAGATGVVAIAAGGYHNLAVKSDGTVVSWGGRLNDAIAPAAALSDIIAVAAGVYHSLALKRDGTVVAWESSGSIQKGGADVPPGLTNVVAISAGHFFSVALTGPLAPLIQQQPLAEPVLLEGNSTSLAVVAAGTEPITFQWQKNGVNLAGQTNDLLPFLNARFEDAGTYTVIVSSPFGVVTSAPVFQIVSPYFVFFSHPQSQTINAGESVTFAVDATASQPFLYQWTRNEVPVPGATNAILTITNAQTEAGTYRLTVTSHGVSKRSDPAILTVNGNVSPSIVTEPRSDRLFLGAKFAFRVSATGFAPLRYQWSKNGVILVGQTDAVLSFAHVRATDVGSYSVEVSNDAGRVASRPATLTLVERPPIVHPPPGTVISLGGEGVPAGLHDAVAVAAGFRHGMALRSNGTVAVWGGQLAPGSGLPPPPGLSNVVAVAAGNQICLALKRDGTVVGWGVLPSPVDLFGVVAIAANDFTGLALKSDGTVVSWAWEPVEWPEGLSNVVSIAAGGASSAALVSDGTVVKWGYPFRTSAVELMENVAHVAFGKSHMMVSYLNGVLKDRLATINLPPESSSAVIALAAGNSHGVALMADGSAFGWNGANLPDHLAHISAVAANFNYTILLTAWPVIIGPPIGLAKNGGETATFNVTAAGQGPFTYQWKKNGVPFDEANESSFSITDLQTSDSGEYSVDVSNSAGLVPSPTATLTVYGAPLITHQPQPKVVFVGAKVVFSVNALGAIPLRYQWRKDGVDLLGETNVTLTLDSVQVHDIGGYAAALSNYLGTVESDAVALRVMFHNFASKTPGTVVSIGGLIPPAGLTSVVAIAAGTRHSLALRSDGTVEGWGGFSLPLETNSTATPPPGLADVVAIAAGNSISLALKRDGTVVVWHGWMGGAPQPPDDLFGVIGIAAGDSHALALKVDGTVVAWGFPSSASVVPPGLSNVIAVAAHARASAALLRDGTVTAWGEQNPLIFASVTGAVAIALGKGRAIALYGDGTLAAFGFSPPDGLQDVQAIAAGDVHGLALKSDGTVVGWNGPYLPEDLGNVTAISGGKGYTLLITTLPPETRLAIHLLADQISVAIPVSVPGTILEETDDVTHPYRPVTIEPSMILFDETRAAALPVPISAPMKFYRLRR